VKKAAMQLCSYVAIQFGLLTHTDCEPPNQRCKVGGLNPWLSRSRDRGFRHSGEGGSPLGIRGRDKSLLPSDLKEGAGSREQGAGGKNIFMLGGETCFIGTAFCPLPFLLKIAVMNRLLGAVH